MNFIFVLVRDNRLIDMPAKSYPPKASNALILVDFTETANQTNLFCSTAVHLHSHLEHIGRGCYRRRYCTSFIHSKSENEAFFVEYLMFFFVIRRYAIIGSIK